MIPEDLPRLKDGKYYASELAWLKTNNEISLAYIAGVQKKEDKHYLVLSPRINEDSLELVNPLLLELKSVQFYETMQGWTSPIKKLREELAKAREKFEKIKSLDDFCEPLNAKYSA